MQIDWWTFVLQAVNFLVLVWLLRRFLYQPVKNVIEKRKAVAEKAFTEAEAKAKEAEAARQRFEGDRAALAQERQDMLNRTHDELKDEREEMMKRARDDADRLIEEAREAIDEQRQAALGEIRDQVAAMAAELASDILSKTGIKASNSVFLEQLEARLKDLPADERLRLQKDLATEGARLTVVTAGPLTSEEQAQWAQRLGAFLRKGNDTEFTCDPEILGGAELRFPHAVIRFSWADQLRRAEELLREDETAS